MTLLSTALAVTIIASTLESAGASVHVPLESGTAAAAATGSGSAAAVGAQVSVVDLSVASVSSTDSGKVSSSLTMAHPPNGRLVAHLREPVTQAFSLLGVVWDHGTRAAHVAVTVRTRGSTGGWSTWSTIESDADGDRRDGVGSTYRDGTAPVWVGDASGVEVAAYSVDGGAPAGLAVSLIDPGASSDVTSRADKNIVTPKAGRFASIPRIVTRREWGADESFGDTCWSPRFGRTFKAVIVHHTAGSNSYSRAEAASVVRGVYAYHTESRGWCDIGYNFLVDRYGTVFEGRAGGIRKPVRGAHAGDYNVNTTGISLMGNFEKQSPSKAMKQAMVSLVAWRLGTAYHGPYGHPYLFDARFARISGHRDVMSTSCPGRHMYDWLPTLRRLVARRLDGYTSPIQLAWEQAGGKHSRLGPVRMGERGENGGRHTTFADGRMYSSAAGIRTLYAGPVLARYVATGETAGDLGYPESTIWTVGHGAGNGARFGGGRIYWSPRTGAKALVRSPVLKTYLKSGSVLGDLGFPRTPVVSKRRRLHANFEHGTIIVIKSSHRTIVRYS